MRKCENPDLMKDLRRAYDAHAIARLMHLSDFEDKLMDNPDEAIKEIFTRYEAALDEAYTDEKGVNQRGFVEAMAGGPFELIPWAVYNAVGAAYPYLDRNQKDGALRQILSILDKRNYAEVNGDRGAGHTTGIREPLLLSDICICRAPYWPGLRDEKALWEGKTFSEIKANTIDEGGMFRTDRVTSDFLVAYAFLRPDIAGFGEEYVRIANPLFLERVLRGIVGMRFSHAKTEEEVVKRIKRLEEILPKSVHPRIELLRQGADWVDYTKFEI